MFKIYFSLLTCVLISFNCLAEKEELEERFKTYIIREHEYSVEEPTYQEVKINEKKITIWAPEINQETLAIKPRPNKVAEALNYPGEFFKKDAEMALNNFEEFSESYRSCVSSKKWPQKAECLKMLDVCFGLDIGPGLCGWNQHIEFSKCTSHKEGVEGLLRCLRTDEKLFELYSKCFDKNIELGFMFNGSGLEVDRRKYFTLDSYFYSHDIGSILCRFTVLNGKQYQLVNIYPSTTSRPGLTVIPKELYAQDNYYELIGNQRREKARDKKEKLRKGKK